MTLPPLANWVVFKFLSSWKRRLDTALHGKDPWRDLPSEILQTHPPPRSADKESEVYSAVQSHAQDQLVSEIMITDVTQRKCQSVPSLEVGPICNSAILKGFSTVSSQSLSTHC